MTFLAPGFLWAAAGAGLLTALLHLLAWRRPRVVPLPTARFIPERPMRVVARAVQPSDLWLLLLRLSIIACLGVALASPVRTPSRSGHARVVVADMSRAVASAAEVRDSVRSLLREGDVLLAFDTTVRVVDAAAFDSLASAAAVQMRGRGRLSSALVAAAREAGRLSRTHDSVSTIAVSPVADEEWDAATVATGNQVPGALRVVRVRAATAVPSPLVAVRGDEDDPVLLAIARSRGIVAPGDGAVIVVRDSVTAADSAFAHGTGHTLVVWPAEDGATGDTVGAVVAGNSVFAASLVRTAGPVADGGRVVARWADAEPAAVEAPLGDGCVRLVRVPVPLVGDAALSIGFSRFANAVTGGCNVADATAFVPVPGSLLDSLERESPAVELPVRASMAGGSKLPAWLLAAALVLALLEPLARRRLRR
jgi:hypothetical protein